MIPKYFQNDATTRDRWMISYLDVLTILLIFFVAVAARNLTPAQLPAQAAQPVPPRVALKPTSLHQTLIETQEKLQKHGLDLRMDARGLVISLPQTVLFPSGEDQISPDALPIVAEIAEVLRDIPNRVSLVGHADSIPIHNHRFKSNWELSASRGLRLLELLSGQFEIPESRLSIASDGAYRPIDSNATPDGRAGNRRVEIVILDEPS